MPLIQFDIPKELDKKLRIEMIQREHKSKDETILEILEDKLGEVIKEE